MEARLVQVVLPLPIRRSFTYLVPERWRDIPVGTRVLVPFQNRLLTGYVLDDETSAPEGGARPIEAVLDDFSLFTPAISNVARFLSRRYDIPLGECVSTILPPGLSKQTKRVFLPTEKNGSPSGPEDAKAYERLVRSRGLDVSATARRDAKLFRGLKKLEKEGWVSISTVLRQERAKLKTVKWFAATQSAATAAPRGRLQAKLLEVIRQRPEGMAEEALRAYGNVSAPLRALVANGWVVTSLTSVSTHDLVNRTFAQHAPVALSSAQEDALKIILSASENSPIRALLHGVTGSGKTEIYLKATEAFLARGKGVIALVPEIALTPQFLGRFYSRFGERVGVLHSGYSDSQRLTHWKRILDGDVRVVVGARSAVFAPVKDLGLLIVDEEHDASYKQDEGVLYHAKDIAAFRASQEGASLVLGSATPSLESYEKALRGEMRLLHLPARVTEHNLPHVEVVDLRKEFRRIDEKRIFSARLRDALAETLCNGDQAILFLNRRGFAPTALCPSCGEVLHCDHCSISLTFHKERHEFLCHYCGATRPANTACKGCGRPDLISLGVGTERVQEELQNYFPDARISRLDRDSAAKKGSQDEILSAMAQTRIDILIGTQMVTKGLDLPHVSLVGVLFAEQALHLPDFRAAERTFQMLTQVSGRAGRGAKRGRAIIQTFLPEHYAIECAQTQDYAKFYAQESGFRKELRYPPFSHLSLIEIFGPSAVAVSDLSKWLGGQARKHLRASEIDIVGPAPAPVQRKEDQTRFHLMVRSSDPETGAAYARWLVRSSRETLRKQKVTLRLDIDPYRFL